MLREDRRLIQSIVDFGDTQVRDVMTPRPDVVAVPLDATLAEVRQVFLEQQYSRVPVYKDTLDHIQGFVWPNADTDRLRSAAQAWRTAAEGVDGLAAQCGDAVAALDTQRSPEVPVAVAATEELRATARDVSAQFASGSFDIGADRVG